CVTAATKLLVSVLRTTNCMGSVWQPPTKVMKSIAKGQFQCWYSSDRCTPGSMCAPIDHAWSWLEPARFSVDLSRKLPLSASETAWSTEICSAANDAVAQQTTATPTTKLCSRIRALS